MRPFIAAIVLACLAGPALADTRTLCLLAVDAESGETLVDIGPGCDERVTPASTFKLAIALMGFDAAILQNASEPELPFEEGYVAWRPEWRQATTPTTWLRDSVVWYSQQVMLRLGEKRASDYLARFGYGNQDISGVAGEGDGLTHAWLSNSIAISPREEAAFMQRLVRRELGVSQKAYAMTATIASYGEQGDGWQVYGKTGAGLPRGTDGRLLRGKPYGWFVGWAEKDGRRVAFAKLVQASEKPKVPPGFTARDSLFEELFARGGPLEPAPQ
ncbi:class D beta-lactamase [Jiella endophytica]|nr:class D beta-lactamase [Jiella endophytica]